MGLLTLTATIIDIIALYLVPNKQQYRQYVFDSSPELRKRLESMKNNDNEDCNRSGNNLIDEKAKTE